MMSQEGHEQIDAFYIIANRILSMDAVQKASSQPKDMV